MCLLKEPLAGMSIRCGRRWLYGVFGGRPGWLEVFSSARTLYDLCTKLRMFHVNIIST